MQDKKFNIPQLMRPTEVAKRTGFGVQTVYEAIYSGQLKAVRPRHAKRGYYITDEDFKDWIENLYVQVN